MSRYFIEVAYKGTAYSGSQVQENSNTIQAELEKALKLIHRENIALTGSSRTDAGVHALQNYFHFDFENEIHPQAVYKLNAVLPSDIAVKSVRLMPSTAHSRFDAISRAYIYKVHQFKNPFLKDFSFFYPYKLDYDLMNEATNIILSQTHFEAFSKTNSQTKTYNCTIYKCSIEEVGEEINFNIEANRFLRGMVRSLAACLLKIGRGTLSIEEFSSLFINHKKSGVSAPAHGLSLETVSFPVGYLKN